MKKWIRKWLGINDVENAELFLKTAKKLDQFIETHWAGRYSDKEKTKIRKDIHERLESQLTNKLAMELFNEIQKDFSDRYTRENYSKIMASIDTAAFGNTVLLAVAGKLLDKTSDPRDPSYTLR